MSFTFQKQDKIIYGWMLKDDGSIEKMPPLDMYYVTTPMYGGTTYHFKFGTSYKSVKYSQIGQFLHNRIYLFEDNDKKALSIIRNALETKVRLLEIDLDKAKNRLDLFREKNEQREN